MNNQLNVAIQLMQQSQQQEQSHNFALRQFLERNPGIETVLDFINHCRARGGEALFHAKCRELGLDPNELCTYNTAELSDWIGSGPELPDLQELLFAAVG